MSASTLEIPVAAAARPEPQPEDLTTGFAGPQALEMVVEMAHDLRSPLTSILFLAETMQSGQSGPLTEAQRSQLALIRSAALCLCASASDVLELARGTRLGQPEHSAFSIGAVFTAIRDMAQPLAEEKGLDLRFAVTGLDGRLGHERALSRALLNLVTNALKYTDHGYVELSARAKGLTRVEFAVRDTGPGIPDEALRTLYEPFHRHDDARLRFSSAGLGLAIVRKLVAAMGAELRVMTRADGGTRFWFEIDLPAAS
jgi:signal transduction histidine kinase